MDLGSCRTDFAHSALILGGKVTRHTPGAKHARPGEAASAVDRACGDPSVNAEVDEMGGGGAMDRGRRMGAWPLHGALGIARRMDSGPRRIVERQGLHGRGELARMGYGHWDAQRREVHVLGERCPCPTSCWWHTPRLGGPADTCDPQGAGRSSGLGIPLNRRCQAILLEKVAGGNESHRTRVRKPCAGAPGLGGPKRSVNRGASDYGAMSLVERLNQTVSIHPDMTDAPTHYHSPHQSHGC